METIESMELELKSIINRYRKEFIAECDTSAAIKHLFDESLLSNKYQANLEKELINTVSNSSIDRDDWNKCELTIRTGIEDLKNEFKNRKIQ